MSEKEVREARERLCGKCALWLSDGLDKLGLEVSFACSQGLEPLTSDGSDCPYFQEVKNDK